MMMSTTIIERRWSNHWGLRLLMVSAVCVLLVPQLTDATFDTPKPLLSFTVQPLAHVLVDNHSPTYLHCTAQFSPELIRAEAQLLDETGLNTTSTSLVPTIAYSWLRNERPLTLRNSHFQAFSNGTLRVENSKIASGRYRCIADDRTYQSGAIVSTSTIVQQAVFKTILSADNITVGFRGGSAVLVCPFVSVPLANTSWWFHGNDSKIEDQANGRFYHLSNGSLLIVNIVDNDAQFYRCLANNVHVAQKPDRTHITLLRIDDRPATHALELLPAMQTANVTLNVGATVRLLCAPRYASAATVQWWRMDVDVDGVHWTQLTQGAAMLVERNATNQTGPVVYNCSTAYDSQLFTVVRTCRSQITYAPPSVRLGIGVPVRRNCTAIGSPAPFVSWYHNGHPIRNGSVVRVNGAELFIRSFDHSHQGVYQCVAENGAGEAVATWALAPLTSETSLRTLRNVTCYPLSATAYLVGFESASRIDGLIVYQVNQEHFVPASSVRNVHPQMLHDKYQFEGNWAPYQAFGLIVRGMQLSGVRTIKSKPTEMYDLSPLSAEVKCAMQGLELNAIVRDGHGVYVWWTNEKLPPVPTLRVQIRTFSGEARHNLTTLNGTIGVWPTMDQKVLWHDIDPMLEPFVASVRIDANLTELTVPGNVSGFILSDTEHQQIRIIVPIMQNGQEVMFNYSFVEWMTIPHLPSVFQADASLDRIHLNASNPLVHCIKVYLNNNSESGLVLDSRPFDVKHLVANSEYTLLVFECDSRTQLQRLNVRTQSPTVPSPIVNLTVERQTPITMTWSTPLESPVDIAQFLVEWQIAGVSPLQQHAVNVSIWPFDTHKPNVFDFPHSSSNDKLNITIRSVSIDGHTSIPVYYNMLDLSSPASSSLQPPHRFSHNNHNSVQSSGGRTVPQPQPSVTIDRKSAIAIGVAISALLLAASVTFIVWHRSYAKRRREQRTTMRNGSRGNGATQSPDRALWNMVEGAQNVSPNTTINGALHATHDAHEMQTLIGGRLKVDDAYGVQSTARTNGNGRGNHRLEDERREANGCRSLPWFSSTPEAGRGRATQLCGEHPAADDDELDEDKPLSSNNNDLIPTPVLDSSLRPLFDETVDQSVANEWRDCAATDTVLPTQGCQQQQLKSTLFGWSYQRPPLVGPNG